MMFERKSFNSEVHDFSANLSEHDFEKVCGESTRPAQNYKNKQRGKLPGLNRTLPRSQMYSCPCRAFGIVPSGRVQGVAFSGSSASKSKLASPHGVPEMKRKMAVALKLKRNLLSVSWHDTNQGD